MTRSALLIGCSSYEDAEIPSLEFAHCDAELLSMALKNYAGFEQSDIQLFLSPQKDAFSAKRANILRALARPPEKKIELLLIFFSGHGFRSSQDGRDYLLPEDAVARDIEISALSLDEIVARASKWNADHTILILDACRNVIDGGKSGLPANGQEAFDPSLFKTPGIAAFFSCSPAQRSFEVGSLGHGIFSYALVEGFSDVGCCRTIADLDRFLRNRVPALCSQYQRPIQIPYTRIEPMNIAEVPIVALKRLAYLAANSNARRRIFIAQDRYIAAITRTQKKYILAMDFGSSTCLAAVMHNDGAVSYIPGSDGRRHVPTALLIASDGDFATGVDALLTPQSSNRKLIQHFKRLLATSNASLPILDGQLTPIGAATLMISTIKEDAETFLGVAIDEVIAAVPANFGIAGCNALAFAFAKANLKLTRLIGEPCAAALTLAKRFDLLGLYPTSSRQNERNYPDKHILIVDIGGGTADLALVDISNIDGEAQLEVHFVAGDNQLGGIDFDDVLLRILQKRIADECSRQQLTLSPLHERQLALDAERLKIALSSRDSAFFSIAGLEASHGLIDLEIEVTREEFCLASAELISRLALLVKSVENYKKPKTGPLEAFDYVLLAGQGCRIYPVRDWIFSKFNSSIIVDTFQDNAVIEGLVLQSGILAGIEKNALLLDALYTGLAIVCCDSGSDDSIEISTQPHENQQRYIILEPFISIPTLKKVEVKIKSKAMCKTITFRFFEVLKSLEMGAYIGSAMVPLEADNDSFTVCADVDANSVMCLNVIDSQQRHIKEFVVSPQMTARAEIHINKGAEYLSAE